MPYHGERVREAFKGIFFGPNPLPDPGRGNLGIA
jgi:hypothetical protein